MNEHRLAAVMVLDLVKHSKRSPEDVQKIQGAIEDVFSKAVSNLEITEGINWKYTGDGYVCTFLGDSAARVIDFLNSSIPNMLRVLKPHDQQIRVGLEYGLLNLRENPLTSSREHFNLPGILAARLENAAEPNEVLCTSTFCSIFSPLHPKSFSGSRKIRGKDREVEAHEFFPVDYLAIQTSISDFLYGVTQGEPSQIDGPLRILVVDDEPFVSEVVALMLKFDGHQVEGAGSGKEALALCERTEFDVVLTDYAMPSMKGDQFAVQLRFRKPNLPIILITAFAEMLKASEEPLLGIDYAISKPFLLEDLRAGLKIARAAKPGNAIWQMRMISPQGNVHFLLGDAAAKFQQILTSMSGSQDVAQLMIRHKAKNLVSEYVESIQPGKDILASTTTLRRQLDSLQRFSKHVQLTQNKGLIEYLTQVIIDLKKVHKDVIVRFETGESLKGVTLPASKVAILSLIICELIDNAIEALKGKGRVYVELDVLVSKRSLYLQVQDDGPGIPMERADRIFRAPYSTKGAGRGLGLYLIREAIAKLGGGIQYEFEKGAVFKALIPLPEPDLAVTSKGEELPKSNPSA